MIETTTFTPLSAAIGGLLIGLAAVVFMGTLGRIAGISGILGGLLASPGPTFRWRTGFLAGLIISAGLTWWLLPATFEAREGFPLPLLITAGLLVGFGTALGSGCTSGHGVCGLSRLSPRALIATVVFMVAGVTTATALHGSQLGGLLQ